MINLGYGQQDDQIRRLPLKTGRAPYLCAEVRKEI